MSGYNTKIITYKNQTQIKHYGRSIKTDYSLSDEQKKTANVKQMQTARRNRLPRALKAHAIEQLTAYINMH